MFKLIFWFAAAVSLVVAALLPYAESRISGARHLETPWNDKFHPDEEVMVDATMDWNDEFHTEASEPVTIQLVCNYVLCGDHSDGRRLDLDWNDGFHLSSSHSFCPAQLDINQEEPDERHLNVKYNDEFHPSQSQSGVYCLIPTPTPE